SSLESRIVTDGITDLHNLTLSFVNRFSDLLTGVLVKASEVKETSTEEQMKYEEEIVNRVSGLQEDIKTFESIVDEMDVFRKTESEQLVEIAELSKENHVVTESLRQTLEEYNRIQGELVTSLDGVLERVVD
ncbi:hypothetical protein WA538_001038, partial [Blastocystis sp. DL]